MCSVKYRVVFDMRLKGCVWGDCDRSPPAPADEMYRRKAASTGTTDTQIEDLLPTQMTPIRRSQSMNFVASLQCTPRTSRAHSESDDTGVLRAQSPDPASYSYYKIRPVVDGRIECVYEMAPPGL